MKVSNRSSAFYPSEKWFDPQRVNSRYNEPPGISFGSFIRGCSVAYRRCAFISDESIVFSSGREKTPPLIAIGPRSTFFLPFFLFNCYPSRAWFTRVGTGEKTRRVQNSSGVLNARQEITRGSYLSSWRALFLVGGDEWVHLRERD